MRRDNRSLLSFPRGQKTILVASCEAQFLISFGLLIFQNMHQLQIPGAAMWKDAFVSLIAVRMS